MGWTRRLRKRFLKWLKYGSAPVNPAVRPLKMRSALYLPPLLILTICANGCGTREVPDHDSSQALIKMMDHPLAPKAIQTSKTWVSENLDLGDHNLDDYYVDADFFPGDEPVFFVQFAHKVHMRDAIIDGIGIEAVYGGFPFYFSITVSPDGQRVLDHYANSI